jgi:hypothetical protein
MSSSKNTTTFATKLCESIIADIQVTSRGLPLDVGLQIDEFERHCRNLRLTKEFWFNHIKAEIVVIDDIFTILLEVKGPEYLQNMDIAEFQQMAYQYYLDAMGSDSDWD